MDNSNTGTKHEKKEKILRKKKRSWVRVRVRI
jgi:hypothetical protein